MTCGHSFDTTMSNKIMYYILTTRCCLNITGKCELIGIFAKKMTMYLYNIHSTCLYKMYNIIQYSRNIVRFFFFAKFDHKKQRNLSSNVYVYIIHISSCHMLGMPLNYTGCIRYVFLVYTVNTDFSS